MIVRVICSCFIGSTSCARFHVGILILLIKTSSVGSGFHVCMSAFRLVLFAFIYNGPTQIACALCYHEFVGVYEYPGVDSLDNSKNTKIAFLDYQIYMIWLNADIQSSLLMGL